MIPHSPGEVKGYTCNKDYQKQPQAQDNTDHRFNQQGQEDGGEEGCPGGHLEACVYVCPGGFGPGCLAFVYRLVAGDVLEYRLGKHVCLELLLSFQLSFSAEIS